MKERIPVVSFGLPGPWHIGPPAPNGCVAGQPERWLTECEIYLADYYGKGAKLYLDTKHSLQTLHGLSVCHLTSEGDVARILELCADYGVKIAVEGVSL